VKYEVLQGLEPAVLESGSQSAAAQIYAEMLGLVCHKDFIDTGSQTVRRSACKLC
jgi:hypothetical protein